MRRITKRNSGSNLNPTLSLREVSVLDHAKQIAVVEYNFSNDGGAVGDFQFGVQLPQGAIVTQIWSDELTNLTSAGAAELSISCGSQELKAAQVITGFSGVQAQNPTATKISATAELKMSVSVAALTAGRIKFAIEYFVSK